MALSNCCFEKLFLLRHHVIAPCYRNGLGYINRKWLKQILYERIHQKYINALNQSNPKLNLVFKKLEKQIFLPRLDIIRNCSRWTKCTSSVLAHNGSRKCQRGKSIQIAEKLNGGHFRATKQKLQETKKKVTKKIGDIKENVLTIPNGLCMLRIATTPVLGYLVLDGWYATSLGIFIFAGFTDVIDGYIARKFPNQQTMIGSFLDPAADKLLVATLFLTLTTNGLIPVPLTSLIILRDLCLMTAGFYIRYVSLPPPKTLSRYFDVSFATAKLSPTAISKANTGVQLSLVAISLAAPVLGYVDHIYLQILWYITASTTILSAASYVYSKNTYKVLTSYGKKEKR